MDSFIGGSSTAHLSNLAQDENERNGMPNATIDLNENQYTQRFHLFQEPEMRSELAERYRLALS